MISERLNIYGHRPEWKLSYCHKCDTLKETVFFFGVCPDHPSHPLYQPEPSLDRSTDPARAAR